MTPDPFSSRELGGVWARDYHRLLTSRTSREVNNLCYHVHEDIWEASQRENNICADPFTVPAAFRSKRDTSLAFCLCLRLLHFAVHFVNQHSLGGPCECGALSTGRSSEKEPYLSSSTSSLQDLKNIKNVKGCRDGMPKSMQTR